MPDSWGILEQAGQSLDSMSDVASHARKKLHRGPTRRAESPLAILGNSMSGGGAAVGALRSLRSDERLKLNALTRLPLLARITYVDQNGEEKIIFVSPVPPPPGIRRPDNVEFSGRNGPKGRLAELPVGQERELVLRPLRGPEIVTVTKRFLFKAHFSDGQWDGLEAWYSSSDLDVTIESMRRFLKDEKLVGSHPPSDSEVALLMQEALDGVQKGRRRRVLDNMVLRSQFILDEIQGSVFRMPIGHRMMLLGPAGTGKTTTLIRRLGQKLHEENLTSEEQDSLSLPDRSTLDPGDWIMFTPSDLLMHYLKEAFGRERVAAPSDKVTTWLDHSRILSREHLGILRVDGKRRLRLSRTSRFVKGQTAADALKLYKVYGQWLTQFEVRRLKRLGENLGTISTNGAKTVSRRIAKFGEEAVTLDNVAALASWVSSNVGIAETFREDAHNIFAIELKRIHKKRPSFLLELEEFGASLSDDPPTDDTDDEPLADVTLGRTKGDRQKVGIRLLQSAMRVAGTAAFTDREFSKRSRGGQVAQWMGDLLPDHDVLEEYGAAIFSTRVITQAKTSGRDIFSNVHRKYQSFRREQLKHGLLFKKKAEKAVRKFQIDSTELDILILLTLDVGAAQLSTNTKWYGQHECPTYLIGYLRALRTQVLVDEAPDFSPVQLGAMYRLAHPHLGSFFACGDFHQRLTAHGVRTKKDVTRLIPDVDFKHINTVYRQSEELLRLAQAIFVSGDRADNTPILGFDGRSGTPPLIRENISEEALHRWLTERILEITSAEGKVPTIAIFSTKKKSAEKLKKGLRRRLKGNNIDVEYCFDGRTLGGDHMVRIFDLQHIKGLEFEAVFFVDLDCVETQYRSLLRNYLYVGATRAATYFGVTCRGSLPPALSELRPMLCEGDWKAIGG